MRTWIHGLQKFLRRRHSVRQPSYRPTLECLEQRCLLNGSSPILTQLPNAPEQTPSTIPSNGDVNPYGVAIVPQGFEGNGEVLQPGDILVSNFNSSTGGEGTGTTIVQIRNGQQLSTPFFQSPVIGLTTALGVLKAGFVIVGNIPGSNNLPTGMGSLQIIDSKGNVVTTLTDSALLDGPWDLTINDQGDRAQVFVSNVLSGTVTRIDLAIPDGQNPIVASETQIASGYAHRTDPNLMALGPTGLAFDAKRDILYVASTLDNKIFAIRNAATTHSDHGTGKVVVQDPTDLHGPLGLVLAPNGDLIVANGDGVNADPNHLNELAEFAPSRHGEFRFVDQFQLDNSGIPGGAFGIALSDVRGKITFAAVDDNQNQLDVWTFQTAHHHGGNDNGDEVATTPPAVMPPATTPSSANASLAQQIDAIFQKFDAVLLSWESELTAIDPQLSAFSLSLNGNLKGLETDLLSTL